MAERIPLVAIVGPTAVGKTELALRIAETLGAEIVSADSRQFYRGMDIGTAKPTRSEMARVRHHLIDVAAPDEPWSLARFQSEAENAIRDIHARGRLALLVGGTGQYVRAVIEGWQPPDQSPDPRLREVLERVGREMGALELHARLKKIDPAAAAQIEAPNLRRSVRALEVILHTGRLFSSQRRRTETPYRPLILGVNRPRPELYARVDARIEAMLQDGLEDETRALLQAGYSPTLPPLSAIGYREMIAYIRGEISLEEAVVLMKRATRRYIRQQSNWFNLEDPAIHWLQAGEPALQTALECIRAWKADGSAPVGAGNEKGDELP